MRGAVKHNENKNPSMLVRCMTDEENRSSQMAHGWTEAYCRYLDYLVTVDITHVAPHHQRHRYESTITMKCSDSDLQLGQMKDRDDYQATTRLLVNIRKEQGRANTHIPKMQRTRQSNTLHPKVQQRLEWLSEHYEEYFSNKAHFLPFPRRGCKIGGKTLNGKTLDGRITHGMKNNGKNRNGDQ